MNSPSDLPSPAGGAPAFTADGETRFRAFFDNAMIGMAATAPDGRWLSVNRALCAMFGYTQIELLGRTWAELTHPDDLPADLDNLARLKRGEIDEVCREKRYIRCDGVVVHARIATRAVRLPDRTIDFFATTVEDISALKAAESRLLEHYELNRKLEEAHNQLLQSEKMASIGQLAAGVAHELNNPIGFVNSNLGSLSTYVDELLRIDSAYGEVEAALGAGHAQAFAPVQALKARCDHAFIVEDLRQLIAESREGLERVRKIVQDLKDFSRTGDTGWEWADLHRGLDSTLNIVWNELKYKAEVVREYAPLPDVRCIPSQLNQVFMNLLVNAAQAIEEHGRIVVRTGYDANSVWIEVEDSGRGIPAENLPRIFEPFFTTKPLGKGTGLGLSLSWGIVQRHGGGIDVRSESGHGTTFRVTLPIDAGPAAVPDGPHTS